MFTDDDFSNVTDADVMADYEDASSNAITSGTEDAVNTEEMGAAAGENGKQDTSKAKQATSVEEGNEDKNQINEDDKKNAQVTEQRKDAINALLNANFETGVPPNKLKATAEFIQKPYVRGVYTFGKWFLIFAFGFYVAYYAISGAYNAKNAAAIPVAQYSLSDSAQATKARNMLYLGIKNARKSITAVLPINMGLDPAIYSALGAKAQAGIQVVVVLSSLDPNYTAVKRYLEYYSGGKALVAVIPTELNYSLVALDASYTMESPAAFSSNFGKAPLHGELTIYRDKLRVKRIQKDLAQLQNILGR